MGTIEKVALRRELGDILLDLSRQKPLVEGLMFKQSKKFENTFYKRYFILHKNYLLYYPHERDYKKDPALQHCTVVKLNGLYLTRPTSYPVGVKHCFVLHTPDPANLRKEMMLATSNRKTKNIWIELLQEQNPSLLPSASESEKSKPPYIRRMRYEKAVHTHGRLVPTVSHSVSPTTRSHPQEFQRSMSTPSEPMSGELHPQLIHSDSNDSDRCTTISENTETLSTSPMTTKNPLALVTPVRPPRPRGRESARKLDKPPTEKIEMLTISSSSSDTNH